MEKITLPENKQRYDKNRCNYEETYVHLAAVVPLMLDLLNTYMGGSIQNF